MPIQSYVDQLEPSADAVIWRYIDMDKFRDLVANEELYFRRADLFKNDDPHEGLPPDGYVRKIRGFRAFDLQDELALNSTQAVNRQFSAGHYLNCWNLFRGETLEMWKEYALEGVAICSRYELLKTALDGMLDRVHLGLVRYGHAYLTGDNILRYIYGKRERFQEECEVRAVLCSYDPVAGNNRHLNDQNFPNREPLDDANRLHGWVHRSKRRRIDVNALLTRIVISPWASGEVFEEVKLWVNLKRFSCPVSFSGLRNGLTPRPEELQKLGCL
jgi:hypothetical protein